MAPTLELPWLLMGHKPAASSSGGSHCCCVSIYVNNNVQGVTNSVLFRSKVTIEDAGAELAFTQFDSRKASQDGQDDGLRMETKTLMLINRILLLFLCLGVLGFILFCSDSGKFNM